MTERLRTTAPANPQRAESIIRDHPRRGLATIHPKPCRAASPTFVILRQPKDLAQPWHGQPGYRSLVDLVLSFADSIGDANSFDLSDTNRKQTSSGNKSARRQEKSCGLGIIRTALRGGHVDYPGSTGEFFSDPSGMNAWLQIRIALFARVTSRQRRGWPLGLGKFHTIVTENPTPSSSTQPTRE